MCAMRAVLDQYLTVYDPDRIRPQLLAMATFLRKGRLKKGEKRPVHYFQQDDERIILPRGLWPIVQRKWPMPMVDHRLRFTARPFAWQGQLYPYQQPVVQAILARQGGTLVAMPGSGKTIMGMALAAYWQQPTLWLVSTLELRRVAEEKARVLFKLPDEAFGFIGDGEGQMGTHLTIGMVQTLTQSAYWMEQLKPRIGTIIVDECVAGNTLVDGKSIGDLAVGDLVSSYDTRTGTFAQKPITHIFRQQAPEALLEITVGQQTIVCTLNHPFWTQNGWKYAGDLSINDWLLYDGGDKEYGEFQKTLPRLRNTHYEQAARATVFEVQWQTKKRTNRNLLSSSPRAVFLVRPINDTQNEDSTKSMERRSASLLLKSLFSGIQEQSQFRNNGTNQSTICLSANESSQSHEGRSSSNQSQHDIKRTRTQASATRRQWASVTRISTAFSRNVKLAHRICRQNTTATRVRLSNVLQNRHRQFPISNRDRSRWSLSQDSDTSSTRSQKGGIPRWIRVDHLTILQRGRDARYQEVCPDNTVYNLEVAEWHTFLANGIVTHNCHHSPSQTFQSIINHFPAAYRLGLSATPNRTDGLGPMMVSILGPRVVLPKRLLLAQSRILFPTVYLLGTTFQSHDSHWAAMEKSRARDRARNQLIVQLILRGAQRRRKILVLVERRDHALLLAQALVAKHIRAKALISNVSAAERNQWWDWVEAGRAVVIATRLANEGLDLPRLDYLILGAAGRSASRLEQQLGRGMRTAQGKTDIEVYDLADWRIPAYAQQARERLAFYEQEGYQIRYTLS